MSALCLPWHRDWESAPSSMVDIDPGQTVHLETPYKALKVPTVQREHGGTPFEDQDPGGHPSKYR